MSKQSFQGQNNAPAPPQGNNQNVYDNPKHGVGRTAPARKSPTFSGSGPTGDPRDMHAKLPQSIEHDGTSTEKVTQKSDQPDDVKSGLPRKGFSKRV